MVRGGGDRGRAAARAVAAAGAVLLALAAAGCERRSDAGGPAPGAPAARVVATAGMGAEVLLDGRAAPGRSVLDGLRGLTPVETAFGGGFVSGMLGRRSDRGGRRDWFFYVDGVLAEVGARDVTLRDGMSVWWDHHGWSGDATWAVVGQWPRPFAARVPRVVADPPLDAALGVAGAAAAGSRWRVRVGSDADLRRRDPAWARAVRDPGAAGMPATVRDGRVEVLAPGGRGLEPVPGARAVAVAVPTGSVPAPGVLLAVAGLDAAAARAAAGRIARDPGVLALRFAVAFDGDGRPLRAAGRDGP
jgi:hypothetical protein